jgi:transposase
MKQFVQIFCPSCQSDDLTKNGHNKNGAQRYRCKACCRSFQHHYTYNACKPGIKDQIITQTLNSSGVRDVSRNLGISKDTVTSVLKKKSRLR